MNIRDFFNIRKKLNSGSSRTVIIKKNILGSFLVKGSSIVISIALIPITLGLLSSEKYGIWITLFSILNWFSVMDIGLGNGFRNKFAEAIALGEIEKARSYVETIYSSIFLIALSLFSIYSAIQPFLDWHKILNLPLNFDEDISVIVWIAFGLFTLQLFLKTISSILLALQKTALNGFMLLCGNIISLLTILVLRELKQTSLADITLVFMLSPIIVFLGFSLFLFFGKLKLYRPKKLRIEWTCFKSMTSLGVKFFLIQITTIIMFSSGNIVITQLYGPEQVTPYNIAFQVFNTTMTVLLLVIAPFWSAYTEAMAKGDFIWVRKVIKRLNRIWLLFLVGIILLLIASPSIYHYWLGDKVKIPFILSCGFALYIALLSWCAINAQFLNGAGKIKIQLYIAIFQGISCIPLMILLAKYYSFGITGIILAISINLLIPALILPIQVSKVINQNSKGLWNE